MADPLSETVDVRGSLRVLRRQARWVVVGVIAGALLGGAYAVISPPAYSTTALVVLPSSPTSSNGTPTRQIATQLRIAKSDVVLGDAGRHVTPKLSAAQISKRISVSGPTNDIVQVRASGSDARSAEQIANAVANSFMAYSVGALTGQSSAVLSQLTTRAAALVGQLQSLKQEIDTANRRLAAAGRGSAEASTETALLGTLRAEQSDTTLLLDQVNASIRQLSSGSTSTSTAAGSSGSAAPLLLQPAATATRSSPQWWIAELALAGAAIGWLLAAILLIALERRNRRPRTRDELAAAVGAPVIGSLAGRTYRDVAGWDEFLARYQLTPAEEWSLRKALRQLGAGADKRAEGGTSVLILSLADDARGLALAPHLAVAAAASGVNTALVPLSGSGSAAAFAAACRRHAGELVRERLCIEATVEDALRRQHEELVVFAAVLDPADPSLAELPPAATTLLSLAAGWATSDDLARVAVAAENLGRPIDGVLVAHPLADDMTSGLLPSHGLAPPTALPTRASGAVSGGRL